MKKGLMLFLSLLLCISVIAGCGSTKTDENKTDNSNESTSNSDAKNSDKNEVVVINYPTMQVGTNTAAPVIAQLVKEFNETYDGKYKIVVEDVPGDSNYVEKIKIQLGSDALPPVVYGGGYNLLDLALSQDLVVDLTPYIEKDPEWKALYSDAAITTNSRNGKIYASSSEGSPIGYFYNKELFAKANIDAPATTWEEFFEQCDKLVEAGVTPLALDTEDSAWITTLWMGALIGTSSDEGVDFLGQMMPDNYNTPFMISTMEKIQLMFDKYTTLDAVGGKYENAANNFLSGNVAMIANGPWMIGDFSDPTMTTEGFNEKVGVAIYPNGFVYDTPIQGFFVTKQDDKKLEEAAIEMVKFFTSNYAQTLALETQGMIPASDKVEITAKATEKYPLLGDFLKELSKANVRTNYLQNTMYPSVLDTMSAELPNLANKTMSAKEFCEALTNSAKKNQ